jgi:hypothetical protein
MAFNPVLARLLSGLEKKQIRHAFIGGQTLGMLGFSRPNSCMELLVSRDDMEKLDLLLKDIGYERTQHGAGSSRYALSGEVNYELDVVHPAGDVVLEMIGRTGEKQLIGGLAEIRVLRLEDIIGLKLQMIKNDPGTESRYMADIKSLASIYGKVMDWPLVEKHAEMFGMQSILNKIRKA